jgi:hypothetical protein
MMSTLRMQICGTEKYEPRAQTPRDYESFPVDNTITFTVLPTVTPGAYRVTVLITTGVKAHLSESGP